MEKKRQISSRSRIAQNVKKIDELNRNRPAPILVRNYTPDGPAYQIVNADAAREENRIISKRIDGLKKSNASQRLRLGWLRHKHIAKTQFKRVSKKHSGLAKNSFNKSTQNGKGMTKGSFNKAAKNSKNNGSGLSRSM